MLANVRCLSSLESVGESLRATLNELAEVAPDWLLGIISPDWFDRYVHRFELQRFPKGEQAQDTLRWQVGEDGWHLLKAATDEHAPQQVQVCPSLGLLRASCGTNISSGSTAWCASGMARWLPMPSGWCLPMRRMRARVASGTPSGWVTSVHLTETCGEEEAVHLIVQAEITAATVQDVEETMPLLRDLQARDLVPEVRLVDSGYVSGDMLASHAQLGDRARGPAQTGGRMATQDGLWIERFPSGLAEEAGAVSPRAPLAELVSPDDTIEARR